MSRPRIRRCSVTLSAEISLPLISIAEDRTVAWDAGSSRFILHRRSAELIQNNDGGGLLAGPTVADVDGDGVAELVVTSTTELGDGAAYLLDAGQLDTDAAAEVVVGVADLNYTNINQLFNQLLICIN